MQAIPHVEATITLRKLQPASAYSSALESSRKRPSSSELNQKTFPGAVRLLGSTVPSSAPSPALLPPPASCLCSRDSPDVSQGLFTSFTYLEGSLRQIVLLGLALCFLPFIGEAFPNSPQNGAAARLHSLCISNSHLQTRRVFLGFCLVDLTPQQHRWVYKPHGSRAPSRCLSAIPVRALETRRCRHTLGPRIITVK